MKFFRPRTHEQLEYSSARKYYSQTFAALNFSLLGYLNKGGQVKGINVKHFMKYSPLLNRKQTAETEAEAQSQPFATV